MNSFWSCLALMRPCSCLVKGHPQSHGSGDGTEDEYPLQ